MLCFSDTNIQQKKLLSRSLTISFNSNISVSFSFQWVLASSSSLIKGENLAGTRDNPYILSKRWCKEEICLHPVKSLKLWLMNTDTKLFMGWRTEQLRWCHLDQEWQCSQRPYQVADYFVYWTRAWTRAFWSVNTTPEDTASACPSLFC